jgi:hypothetical protein
LIKSAQSPPLLTDEILMLAPDSGPVDRGSRDGRTE